MTFTPREDWCSQCNGHGYVTIIESDGFTERRCDVCEGDGKMPAGCAYCERGMPLDAEGFCQDCAAPVTVSELGGGWHRVAA